MWANIYHHYLLSLPHKCHDSCQIYVRLLKALKCQVSADLCHFSGCDVLTMATVHLISD